ncbi:MAG: putative tubulin-tyrosine ligase family protein [Streblomastix strix]|uniref:Putative tubulin-tyrosine ligase family protein n=1 Tax=Streblomastix strix TaxID=222440 RepID=A0A5J4W8Y8_9EUKA|nr:MAG: putative tubulin-tyrosine ligase family protein [Streblomastix strix]
MLLCTQQSRNAGKMCVNLDNCRYDIVRYSAHYLDFRDCSRFDHCCLFWADNPPTYELLSKLMPHQVLSRFPLMNELARKGTFFQHINRLRLTFPSDFRFVPRTWVLPQDWAELQEEFALATPEEKPRTYIVKPSAGSQGHGIYLAQTLNDIGADAQVVQRYVDRPFLLDGLKFDFRIYVLISSVAPLEIWLGREGLARFCTKKYDSQITRENITNTFMHLTNYAVNKFSSNFIRIEDAQDEEKASKRSLSSVTRQLKQRGYDVETMWDNIVDVIIKTCIAIQPSLLNSYALYASEVDEAVGKGNHIGLTDYISEFYAHQQTQNLSKSDIRSRQHERMRRKIPLSQCFHIIGFDILLDYRLRPWIVEINHSPSLVTDSPLDQKIKFQVITGAIRLCVMHRKRIGEERIQQEQKRKEKERKRIKQNYDIKDKQDEDDEDQINILNEGESEDGFYRRIYPINQQSQQSYEQLPEWGNQTIIQKMQIYNSIVLHECFYKACGVKVVSGLKTLSENGYSNTQCMHELFQLYAKAANEQRIDLSNHEQSLNFHSKISNTLQSIAGRPLISLLTNKTNVDNNKYMDARSQALSGLQGWKCSMNQQKFCQFGRLAGLTNQGQISQADLNILYNDVTKHAIAETKTGSVISTQNNSQSGNQTSLDLMCYGEFCSAIQILAQKMYHDIPVLDAIRKALITMEEKFVRFTIIPTINALIPSTDQSPLLSFSSYSQYFH